MLDTILKNALCGVAHAIATQFGSTCEVVVHDLTEREAADHSIIYVENGHVTGRKVGGNASGVVLQELALTNQDKDRTDHIGYLSKTKDGKLLKCSTIYIKDESGKKVIAILSINQDITALSLATSTLNELSQASDKEEEIQEFNLNVTDILDQLIWQSVELVGKPVNLMTKDDKIKALRFLNDKGAMLITKSGDKIAEYFGISKFTLYSYIQEENK